MTETSAKAQIEPKALPKTVQSQIVCLVYKLKTCTYSTIGKY